MADLLPDAEQIVSRYLQTNSDVMALIAARTYTEIPNSPTFPLQLVRRIGGQPIGSRPLYHDRALLQIDAYGGAKKLALTIAETTRAVLADDAFSGVHTIDGEPVGVVAGVEFGSLRWLPDDAYTKAKPRYSFDVAIHTHSVIAVGS